jgi:predicted small secreted protein
MKRKLVFLCALFFAALVFEGCATIRGVGEDIQSLGRALKRIASNSD